MTSTPGGVVRTETIGLETATKVLFHEHFSFLTDTIKRTFLSRGRQAFTIAGISKVAAGGSVIEMLVRLGLALFLSLGLAVLLAWGWDSSDDRPSPTHRPLAASASAAPLR